MLREFRVNGADAPAANYVANVELKTGMGVVKDYATGKAKLPASATAEGIFLVAKQPIATGIYAGTDQSDYFDEYNTVAKDDTVVLYSYRDDSAFGTDQYDSAIVDSTFSGGPVRVNVGTNGKWAVAISSATSKYLATGLYDDAGHTLLRIEVVDTAAANT